MNFSCAGLLLSRTVRPTEYVPAAVGVPERVPLAPSARPAGILPEATLQLYGAVPPVAVRVTLYADPTVPLGSDVVVMASGGAFLAAEMLNSTAADFTPVTLFISCSSAVPGEARLALSTGLATVVSFSSVVVSGLPFHRTTVASLMCEPTIWTVVLPDPAVTACGMIWSIAGTPAPAVPTPPQPATKKQNAIAKPAPNLLGILKAHP